MKQNYIKIGLVFAFIVMISLFFSRSKLLNEQTHVEASPAVIPTLFLHGYKGSERSFATMLDRMEKQELGKRAIVCYVRKDGRVSIKGKFPKNVEHPFIQVVFENNRAQLSEQTKWLETVMKQLKEQYHIEEINVVGHSMGGLALTNYTQVTANQEQYPRISNLVTIGSPFHGINRPGYFDENYGKALIDLKPNSEALQSLKNSKNALPADMRVLSIAGVVQDPLKGDGVVSLESALGNGGFVSHKLFSQKIVKGGAATHSGLHEMEAVDQLVADFLWNSTIQ